MKIAEAKIVVKSGRLRAGGCEDGRKQAAAELLPQSFSLVVTVHQWKEQWSVKTRMNYIGTQNFIKHMATPPFDMPEAKIHLRHCLQRTTNYTIL